MRILTTFPGKIGDALWSLPTVRAISRHFGVPVHFAITPEFDRAGAGLLRLIGEQEYIASTFALPGWEVEYKECMQPREPEVGGEWDRVFHLGYYGWPSCALAKYIHEAAAETYQELAMLPEQPDMSPWIMLSSPDSPPAGFPEIFVGWNQEWLELKMGLLLALVESTAQKDPLYSVVCGEGMRHTEWEAIQAFDAVELSQCDLYEAAKILAHCHFYLGDLSAQWVLACAMGKPCVVMEPSEARWNPIFWWDGEGRNRMVLGGDGKPTFDARHVRDAVLAQLKEIK